MKRLDEPKAVEEPFANGWPKAIEERQAVIRTDLISGSSLEQISMIVSPIPVGQAPQQHWALANRRWTRAPMPPGAKEIIALYAFGDGLIASDEQDKLFVLRGKVELPRSRNPRCGPRGVILRGAVGRDGSLAYRATYHLRSQDYYSSRNYASRLIGRELIFYTPTVLQPWGPAPAGLMPAMRRWNAQLAEDFQRILPATRIFRSDAEFDPMQPLALHTVTRCDLATAPLRCESSAVLGALGRVFYVSNPATYTGLFTFIRDLFTQLPESKIRGYSAGRFSFNVAGGRCEECEGDGLKKIEMNFLPDVYVTLRSLQRETLQPRNIGASVQGENHQRSVGDDGGRISGIFWRHPAHQPER